MAKVQQINHNGIGVLGLLGVVFVTLKLLGVITWSWWWVTAPFWGGFAILLAFGLTAIIVAMLVGGWQAKRRQRR